MTIPANQIVNVNPAVLAAGGNALALNGLFLTQNTAMPAGAVYGFASSTAVKNFFGPASTEYTLSLIYFAGYVNSTLKPSNMLFAAYNLANRAAFLQSGSLAGLTLAQLQGLAGASVTGAIGATFTATGSTTNLTVTAVTGLISIGDTISGTGVTAGTTILSQTSGTTGGAGVYVTSLSTTISGTTCTSFGTVLNVTAIASGQLNVGNSVTGTGVPANATIASQVSGTVGGIGVYTLSVAASAYAASTTVSGGGILTITLDGVAKSTTLVNLSAVTSFSNAASVISAAFTGGPTITWNPVTSTFLLTSTTTGTASSITFGSGSLAAPLFLTSATGALVSPGALADTPSSCMANVIAISQNWATFMTLWEPNTSNKLLFAAWSNAQNNRYAYLGWDSDVLACTQGASTTFGAQILALQSNGVIAIGGDPAAVPAGSTLAGLVLNVAAFLSGAVASINFSQRNGRANLAFKSQGSLVPTCANLQTATNLLANGYNYYGSYATANQGFVFFYNGQIPGVYKSLTRLVNQIYLSSQFQLALFTLLTSTGSLPYNPQGYGMERSALLDPISAAINFGTIRTNVQLSAQQISDVNQAAGLTVAPIIATQGYYLQILDPGATARSLGQTPIVNFFYTDGGDVLQISLASIDIL